MNGGFAVSRSHACAGSLKTSATRAELHDVFRSWVKNHPVKMENVKDNSPTKHLLSIEPKLDVNWTRNPASVSSVSKIKLVRYQQNPTPNWGPGSKPGKRKRDTKEDEDE